MNQQKVRLEHLKKQEGEADHMGRGALACDQIKRVDATYSDLIADFSVLWARARSTTRFRKRLSGRVLITEQTMGWMDALNDVVQRYSGASGGTAPAPENPHEDYQRVVQSAPPQAVANGLSQAFRSDQTPAFPEMVSNLFSHSDASQRAGLLNRLLGALGGGALSGFLPGLVGGQVTPQQASQVTPQQASQVTPQQVGEIATHAQRQNPSIVDEVSGFYAQHPQVVKALGGLALTIALQHMMRQS